MPLVLMVAGGVGMLLGQRWGKWLLGAGAIWFAVNFAVLLARRRAVAT